MNKRDIYGNTTGYWEEETGYHKWCGNYVNGEKDGLWYCEHKNGELNDYKLLFKHGVLITSVDYFYDESNDLIEFEYWIKNHLTIHKEDE